MFDVLRLWLYCVRGPPSRRTQTFSLTLAFAQGPARRYNATVLRRLAAAWLRDRGRFRGSG